MFSSSRLALPEKTARFIAALPADVAWQHSLEPLTGFGGAGLPLTMHRPRDEVQRWIPQQQQHHGGKPRGSQQQGQGTADPHRALKVKTELARHGGAENQANVG